MTRVALDLMGGDHAPVAVLDGALLVAERSPDVQVLLVGPPDVAEALLAERGQSGRLEVVPASEVVTMDEDPARAIRAKRDATVRVCARLVRDGQADALVSVGSTGAALAAAVFTLGRLRGISRPPLAAVIPAKAGALVFLDAGANPEADAALLGQYALAGSAFASVRLGIAEPRVGLLTIGEEAGKGDAVRKEAYDRLHALPITFVGNVEGRDIPMGGAADVIVTDGFTGNVLIKGLEGAAAMLTEVLFEAMTSTPERKASARELLPAFGEATARMRPEAVGGAMLLGVDGVVVVGHGAASPEAVAACIDVAVQAAREGLVPRTRALLEQQAELEVAG
ncbi:MAG: phosphate acyltransferase PlsX [Actinobacteria bacterium]|nr:phosphate acyltransferase PlsX [Actinomycetota bacterium]MCA1720384.1 phosphate acyltransferase PlsX [Actinomycetota bacterium]